MGLKDKLCWLFTLSFIFIVYFYLVIPQGMYFDGLTYSSISRNLSMGIGSYWQPINFGPFYEHPPLMFWIQSIFFNILSTNYLTEKLYCLIVLILTIILIAKFWKLFSGQLFNAWIPILLWYLMPTVLWAYQINFHDNTLALFCLIATYFLLRSILLKKNTIFYTFIAIFFIFCGVLVKGPLALYVFAVPIIFSISIKSQYSFRKALFTTCLMIAVFSGLFFILFSYEPAKYFLIKYFNQQVISSVAGHREKINSSLGHFYIIKEILVQLILIALIYVLSLIVTKRLQKSLYRPRFTGESKLFLLIGLSSSIPIAISIKQSTFYLCASLPYFALFGALFLKPFIVNFIEKINLKAYIVQRSIWISAIGFVIIISLSVFRYNSIGIGRDRKVVELMLNNKATFSQINNIGVSTVLIDDWVLRAYLQRYYLINCHELNSQNFIILKKDEQPTLPDYKKIYDGEYVLYQKN